MQMYVILSLLVVTANARPQVDLSSDWKPITIEPRAQRFRESKDTRIFNITTNPALKDSVKLVTDQLTNNKTKVDFTLDTRTPPKIKLQQKIIEKKQPQVVENSHPGIAVPVDVDTFLLTSTTPRKAIIYRTDHKSPTTNSGISTWILLSGQSTTPKPLRKQTTTTTTTKKPISQSITISKITTTTEKTTKPTMKIKQNTTKKPKTTTLVPTTEEVTTLRNKIMTKIKASVLNNAASKNKSSTTSTTPATVAETKLNTTKSDNTEANDLQPEAKDGSLDLTESTTTKRPRRPSSNKRKNNKNRRRKPTSTPNVKTATNSTKLTQKQKPISTQIYNYLSREVMPTVGMGLVGLVVTAGLASYFLFPFTGLRRTFEGATDRKDFYNEDYGGGVAEEELIGKVIAGMPENDYSSSYRNQIARKDMYKNEVNYNQNHPGSYFQPPQNDYQTVSVGSKINYGRDVIEKESGYTVADHEMEKQQFVVGSIPKEFNQPVTPIAVPEHGPRNLRLRRFAQNDKENEVLDYASKPENNFEQNSEKHEITSQTSIVTTPVTTVIIAEQETPNFFTFVRNLLELKVKSGLGFLLRTTETFSRYLKGVQERVNNILRESRINYNG